MSEKEIFETIAKLFAETERQREIQYQKREIQYQKERELDRARHDEALQQLEQRLELERKNREEERQNADRAFDARMSKMNKELNRQIGGLGHTLGAYAEAQTKERILKLFRKRGIDITSLVMNYEETKDNDFFYEIDILLYDSDVAIVVEVKNRVKKTDIDEHIERMAKCVERPPRGAEGKTLLGAIAAMVFPTEIENYARKKGFFVIKPSGKSVKIANDDTFKPQEWKANLLKR